MSPRISLTIMATRQCGECKECCVVLPILDEELSKPGHQPCKHLCGCGCDVYKERPGVCRDYECLWLSGGIDGDERTRPDNLGVIFQRSTWDDSLAAIGCRPGALATPQAQDVISRLRNRAEGWTVTEQPYDSDLARQFWEMVMKPKTAAYKAGTA